MFLFLGVLYMNVVCPSAFIILQLFMNEKVLSMKLERKKGKKSGT